jgi:hypothetical protein
MAESGQEPMNKAIIDGQQQPVHNGAGGLVTSGVLPADVASAPGVTRDSRGIFVAGGAGKSAAVGESDAGGAGDARGAADEPPTSELPSAVGGPGKDAAGGAGASGDLIVQNSTSHLIKGWSRLGTRTIPMNPPAAKLQSSSPAEVRPCGRTTHAPAHRYCYAPVASGGTSLRVSLLMGHRATPTPRSSVSISRIKN